MARQIVISESELLEELRKSRRMEAPPDPPGAFVISELARKNGNTPRTIRAQLAALQAKGRVERCKVYREGSDGRHMMVSAYRILKESKAR